MIYVQISENNCSLTFFGGHKAVARPDPIPNSAVKHSIANGSGCIASARVGCRQFFLKRPVLIDRSFFISALQKSSLSDDLELQNILLLSVMFR
jgi:hypothetical protein